MRQIILQEEILQLRVFLFLNFRRTYKSELLKICFEVNRLI